MPNLVFRNIGVLQTTVAELVTVKEHQRTCILISMLLMEVMLTKMLDSSRLYYHAYGLVHRVNHWPHDWWCSGSTLYQLSRLLSPRLNLGPLSLPLA